MMGRKMCKEMHKEIRLEVDGKMVELPPVEGIIILNILRYFYFEALMFPSYFLALILKCFLVLNTAGVQEPIHGDLKRTISFPYRITGMECWKLLVLPEFFT